uniref:Uncharacterized protein n=1 Tax=Anguilla anguilla TaxID=7936 RepID=A0A0E9VAG9_ANGAN
MEIVCLLNGQYSYRFLLFNVGCLVLCKVRLVVNE